FLFADPANGWPAIDRQMLLDKLCVAMKPGAVLGLVDHAADPDGDAAEVAKTLHRVDPKQVKDDFAQSCFTLEAEAEFLQNADDDHTLSVFDPAIRGKTDRFVYRFIKE
ncbi:MAG: methyltransferase, partial [Lysobacterales bacterium]